MKLINAITDELKAAAQLYIKNEIDLEEFGIRVDMIADHLKQIDVNTDNRLSNQSYRFGQLLNKTKHTALAALNELKHLATGNKRIFNSKVRRLLETKLYFKSLYWTIRNSLYMRDERDKSVEPTEFDLYQPIFIMKENSENI